MLSVKKTVSRTVVLSIIVLLLPFLVTKTHAEQLQEKIKKVEVTAIRPAEGSKGTNASSSDPKDWAELIQLPAGVHYHIFSASWLGPDGIFIGPDITFTKGIPYTMLVILIGDDGWYFSDTFTQGDVKVNNGTIRSFEIEDSTLLTLKIDVLVLEPEKLTQTLTVTSKYTKKYDDKPFYLDVKSNGNGMPQYTVSKNSSLISISESGLVTIKGTGKVVIKVYAPETESFKKSDTKTITLNIRAAKNPMTVTGKTVSVKYSTLKKKKIVIPRKKLFTVKQAKGTVTFKKASSGTKKITVSKGGIITIKKGLKKGTYPIRVSVTAAGNANYSKISKIVTIKVKVK